MDKIATAIFHIQPNARVRPQRDFFVWIRRNPLKSPESAKGIQGKTREFSLDLFGFPCFYLQGNRLQVVVTGGGGRA
jgi:hypothetical protein